MNNFNSSESDEFLTKRKSKYKYKKKKKKKILLKILIGLAVFVAVKCLLYKYPTVSCPLAIIDYWFINAIQFFQFFPTTGRDELYPDNDQLFHDGIEIDRASDWLKAQEIAIEHRSIFPPAYDETRMKKDSSLSRKSKRRTIKGKKRKLSNIKAQKIK